MERDDRRSRSEDRTAATALRRRDPARLCAGREAGLDGRKGQGEARAFARRAVQAHIAAHRPGEPTRDRKAEARSALLRMGALEPFEDALLVARGDPRPP